MQLTKIKDASPVGPNDSGMLTVEAQAHGFRLQRGGSRGQAACVAFLDAHRFRCASAMRFRVAALNRRLFPVEDPADSSGVSGRAFTLAIHLGGRPRRFARLPVASLWMVSIASSSRSFSERSSARILWISMAN